MRLAAFLFLALFLSAALACAGQPEDGGDAAAQFKLGAAYMTGNGVPKDYAEAMKLFRASADQGYAPAQQNIGWLYYQGLGVKQDYADAYFWLLLAKKTDAHMLSPYIEKSAQHLSPEQIAGVRRVVQDWKPATAQSPGSDTPALARYLAGAEIQAETGDQRAAVRQALNDMTTLSQEQLRKTHYGPEKQSLPVFLRAHVVPSAPVPVEDDDFFTKAADPGARAAVKKLLESMGPE